MLCFCFLLLFHLVEQSCHCYCTVEMKVSHLTSTWLESRDNNDVGGKGAY